MTDILCIYHVDIYSVEYCEMITITNLVNIHHLA